MKDIGSAQSSAFLDELASLVRGSLLTLGEHLTDHRTFAAFSRSFSSSRMGLENIRHIQSKQDYSLNIWLSWICHDRLGYSEDLFLHSGRRTTVLTDGFCMYHIFLVLGGMEVCR
jgi:hypothetical protein